VTSTFDLFNRKLALHLLVSKGTFIPILIFLTFFLFSSYVSVWDRPSDGRTRGVMRPIRRPH